MLLRVSSLSVFAALISSSAFADPSSIPPGGAHPEAAVAPQVAYADLDEPPIPFKRVANPPTAFWQQRPEYPPDLRKQGVQGSARTRFVVRKDGKIADAQVLSATDPRFGAAALEAVSAWRFRPGTVDGKAVNTLMEVPINFTITPDDAPAPAVPPVTPPPPQFPRKAGVYYDVSKVDKAPVIIHQGRPHFPADLKIAKIEGSATILFTVEVDGTVDDLTVLTATRPEFADSATTAVSHWRFKPALIAGKPVACRMGCPIVFNLFDY